MSGHDGQSLESIEEYAFLKDVTMRDVYKRAEISAQQRYWWRHKRDGMVPNQAAMLMRLVIDDLAAKAA